MCRRVTCKQCGKPSWAGCGAHVESVLADVPKQDRCRCREQASTKRPAPKASKSPATEEAATEDASAIARFKSWLQR